jgi:hypothetical protein
MWNREKGAGEWCPENDGAYMAEQAAIHGDRALADVAAGITATAQEIRSDLESEWATHTI